MANFRNPIVSLRATNIGWVVQRQQRTVIITPPVIAKATIGYDIQTSIAATAIMEWNIGVPIYGQIRQTAQDRMDFAY